MSPLLFNWSLSHRLLLCAFSAALLAPSALAREVEISNHGVPEHRVARVRAQVEGAFDHVRARTGLEDRYDIRLVLVAGERRFSEFAADDGVAMNAENVLGYAQPARRRVVLNFSAIDERGLEALGVLRHEIAHLVLGTQLRSPRPLWFEEGVANYVENIALNALREGSHYALVQPSIDSLDDLSLALRDDRAGAAYPESRRVVQLIAGKWGEPALRALIANLREPNIEFAAAFRDATGADLAAWETSWQEQRQAESDVRFVAWLGANWWWLLFAFAAVLMVAGLWIRKRRGRRQVAAWEEQEKHFPSDPAWSYTPADEGFSADDDNEAAPRR